jgi:hypothetical protein
LRLLQYTDELEILKKLFDSNFVENRIENIEKIFDASEFYWNNNLKYVIENDIKIKYLLIGEAPPDYEISNKEEVKYFYNPNNISVPQSYLEKVFNAFYPDQKADHIQYNPDKKQHKLNHIADKGFLLIDSLPFAMNYSGNGKRNRAAYKKLVKVCAASYLSNKLKNSKIPWHPECVKIAFSVWLNAREVLANWPRGLPFKHCVTQETETSPPFKQVAVNGAWYLCEKALRRIFLLYQA